MTMSARGRPITVVAGAAVVLAATTFAVAGCGSAGGVATPAASTRAALHGGGTGRAVARISTPTVLKRMSRLAGGIGVRVPAGWHLTAPPITDLGYPTDRLLLTSYAAHAGGNCAPDGAVRELPAGGALAYLLEYASASLRRRDFPPRPAHLRLRARDLGRYECWRRPSYLIRFRASGRPFQLHVVLGPHASGARRAQVLRALDSLRIAALPKQASARTATGPRDRTPARDRGSSRRSVTSRTLDGALRHNPGQPAATASCRPAGANRDRARAPFGRTHAALFVCRLAFGDRVLRTYDVQVLGNRCFVGEAREVRQADYGCIRR